MEKQRIKDIINAEKKVDALKTIAMIPARLGSKGLKNKNILILDDIPLLAHSIKPALKCELIDEVYVNSDSELYLDIGEKYGAKRYLRKNKLADDNASMKPVIKDFNDYLVKNYKNVDCIVILYPTYPFRTAKDLSDTISQFRLLGGRRSIVGMKEPSVHPYLVYTQGKSGAIKPLIDKDMDKFFRRQDFPEAFELTHWTCIIPLNYIDKLNNCLVNSDTYGYMVNKRIVDIDTVDDFMYAKHMAVKYKDII